MNEEMVNSGLIPRFLVLEYKGKRAYFNENRISEPPIELVKEMVDLMNHCKQLMHNRKVIDVQIDRLGYEALTKFDKYSTDIMNDTDKGFVKHLWNRSHLNIQRLAALVAIGINHYHPVITVECVNWAANLIVHNIQTLTAKFDTGDIGEANERRQENDIIRIMIEYCTRDWKSIDKYKLDIEKLHNDKVVPYSYLSRRLGDTASFRNDKNGPTAAMKRTIQNLIDSNKIIEIGKPQMQMKYGKSMRAFMLV
jgi:hypothetical protein